MFELTLPTKETRSPDVSPKVVSSNTVKDPLTFALPPRTTKASVDLLPDTKRNVSDPAPKGGENPPMPSAFEDEIISSEGFVPRLREATIWLVLIWLERKSLGILIPWWL